MTYELEIEKAIEKINETKAKRVCCQLPDGLKHYAKQIVDKIEEKTNAVITLWLGSCYGACYVQFYIDRYVFDLLIQWVHSKWRLEDE